MLRILFATLCFFTITGMSGQNQSTPKGNNNPLKGVPFKDRLFLGGDFGLSFGTITFVRIAPLLGYNVTPRLAFGLGPSYQYWSDSRFAPKLSSSIYGGAFFGRYFVFENVFAESSLEILNLEEISFSPSPDFERSRVTIPVWFVGAGFSQRNSRGSGFFIAAYYDLIQNINSPYPNNISLRIGGFIGL